MLEFPDVVGSLKKNSAAVVVAGTHCHVIEIAQSREVPCAGERLAVVAPGRNSEADFGNETVVDTVFVQEADWGNLRHCHCEG